MLRDVDLLDRTPDTHYRPAPTPSRQLAGTSAGNVAKVAAGAAAGAAIGGGIPGAVAGAAKSAGTILVRSRTGRRFAAFTLAALTLLTVLAVAAVTGGGSMAGLQAEQGSGDARAVTAATQAGIPTGTLTRLREATVNSGIQWQVIAAIYHTQQSQTGGTGPFHIDTTTGQVPADTAADAASSAALLANRVQALLRQQPGYTDRADIGAGSVVHDDGTVSWPPQRQATHQTLAAQYVAALKQLPLMVVGGLTDAWARGIFDTATQWRVGQAASQGGQTGVTVCAPVGDGPLTIAQTDGTPVTVSPTQLAHAATIVHVGKQLGVTDAGLVVAIMVGLQESGLHTYANSNVPQSLLFPHETVGHDHLSVNIFQQQPWWGPDVASLMDETFAAKAFFGRPDGFTPHPAALLDVDATSLTPGQWAQAVQQSAYPDAYDKWQPVAAAVVGKVKGVTCTSSGQPGSGPFVADNTWASVIALERSRLGTPYSWGGGSVNGPGLGFGPGAGVVGWDCSSFQQWAIYQATGGKVDITRTTASQTTKYESTPYLFAKGPPLQPGDLLYWGVGSASHHVALYSGDGMMLEETRPGSTAQQNRLRTDYTAVLRLDLQALSTSV